MASRELRADGELTRGRILEAAGELFAAHGFAETTNKAIATEAGVDLASINYHFGSRSGLYQAALIEAHRRVVDLAELEELTRSELPASDKLRLLFGKLVQRVAGQTGGWHLSVLVAELLAPSSHLQILFGSEIFQKKKHVEAMLGEISGIPLGDPALTRCVISVVAPCLMLLIGKRGIPGPLQEMLRMQPDEVADHLHKFAIGGLKAIGHEYSKE